MKQQTSVHAFNRGLLSRLGIARLDLNRTALSAEVMTNWMPRILGSMSLRPGLGFIGEPAGRCINISFVFSADDIAKLELSDNSLRVWIDDELVTRPTVTAAITNGEFATTLNSWTDTDEAGATSAFATGGFMSLVGTGSNEAKRIQQVTVHQVETEHALRIVIERGPVTLRVGSTSDADDYIAETTLRTGSHSLAFTPSTPSFWVSFSNRNLAASLVDSIAVESAGTMDVPTPWETADLPNIRWDTSADVIFVACDGHHQQRIERRGAHSWSVVLYESDTGPFMNQNITPITLTPSALNGDVTLTASKALFKPENVGSLYRITSSGQTVTATLSGNDQFTDPIRVTGTGGQRTIGIILSGVVDSIVTLQYSVESPGSWVDTGTTFTTDVASSYNDDLDNQLIYYRIGIKAGDYGSDTIDATLNYSAGSITGVARVTDYTSSTVVSAAVLSDFGAITASSEWWESFWSERRGFPTAVSFYEGRLYWFGRSWIWGSISDAFDDFDDFFEGDAGPIIRTIASGPVDVIHWALPLERLIAGTALAEQAIRSTSFDEPVTPSNFHVKASSSQGSANVPAVLLDEAGLFVHRNGERLYQIGLESTTGKHIASDLTVAVPDLNAGNNIVRVAVQSKPDTRIHCVRDDGTAAVLVLDRAENVSAWVEVETSGNIEDVCVLPDEEEDAVYYVVSRGNGRFHERFAMESECVGGTLNKQADSFSIYDDINPTDTITGLTHLADKEVIVWADGRDLGALDVDGSGVLALEEEVFQAVIGLPYTADFKSMKLGQALGTPLNLKSKIASIGLVAQNLHAQGLQFGPDFDHMDSLPAFEAGAEVDADAVHETYDYARIPFPGDWTTDSRICLRATAPRPATVLAASITMQVSG